MKLLLLLICTMLSACDPWTNCPVERQKIEYYDPTNEVIDPVPPSTELKVMLYYKQRKYCEAVK